MSPSSPAGVSSPLPMDRARRSRFAYRHFSQLATWSTWTPLRVVAHIDLDAFYAQCEMIRLGVPEGKPLAVQQWQGLIAVNYAARDAGIGRHCDVTEAKKLCPDLVAQHVATWREGDDRWAYRDDAAANIATDKVSLDPYRLQSRKILAVVKESLHPNRQKVEKASIDEVFLDLSAQVHSTMLERFPELSNPPPYDDTSEALPLPSISALDWKADALVDLEEEQEAVEPDWDDVAILIGSEIVRDVRARIRAQLGYTCSGGVANNKLVSKLGSSFKKPNRQTVVRGRAVHAFLTGFKVTKMRNLGGKLGDQVVSSFNTTSVAELLQVSLDQMQATLGHDTGLWVYNTIRGIDASEVNSRTQIKSMLSAKSFRPTITSAEQAARWLRIFVADIYARLVEEGVVENRRRPRTINLHYRHAGQTRSRQSPIPNGRALDERLLLDLTNDLLGQIIAEGRLWPCANLSLSVGGFENGVRGNMGIDAFVVRGDEAESIRAPSPESRPGSTGPDRPPKKRRVENGGIQRFFAKRSLHDGSVASGQPGVSTAGGEPDLASPHPGASDMEMLAGDESDEEMVAAGVGRARQRSLAPFGCSRCEAGFDDAESLQSHEDWHMAKDIQDEEGRVRPAFAERVGPLRKPVPKGAGASSKRGRGGKLEQGQSRLKFG